MLRAFFVCVLFLTPWFAFSQDGLDFYVRAEKLRHANNFRGAIDEYNNAIKIEPNNHKYHFQKGDCYVMLRDEDNAISSFQRAATVKESYVEAYLRLAWLYQKRNDLTNTIYYLDLSFQYESDISKKIDYKKKILNFLFQSGTFTKAKKHIKDAIGIAPNDMDFLYFSAHYDNENKQYTVAESSMQRAIGQLNSVQPKVVARYYYELGYSYHHQRKFDQAKDAFSKANFGPFQSLIAEMTPEYNFALAYAYFHIYEYNKSKKVLDYVLEMDPNHPKAHDLLVEIAKAKNDKVAVIQQKKVAIAAEPDQFKRSEWYKELCVVELQTGRYSDAVISADECLKIQANNYNISFIKAIGLYKTGKKREAQGLLLTLSGYPGLDLETKAKFNLFLGIVATDLGDSAIATRAFKSAAYGPYRYAALSELRKVS